MWIPPSLIVGPAERMSYRLRRCIGVLTLGRFRLKMLVAGAGRSPCPSASPPPIRAGAPCSGVPARMGSSCGVSAKASAPLSSAALVSGRGVSPIPASPYRRRSLLQLLSNGLCMGENPSILTSAHLTGLPARNALPLESAAPGRVRLGTSSLGAGDRHLLLILSTCAGM